ncbi:MAG: hypothetical protein JSW13_01725 [Candidatus Aerophobus sp.]|nr:MAG: hypothetical protein JSW13_01725 [Candidatus Aerophobus sp.]
MMKLTFMTVICILVGSLVIIGVATNKKITSEEYQKGSRQKHITWLEENSLPQGATNVVDLDNGWYEFELGTNKFIVTFGYRSRAVTQVR